jgi:hypothetical protein
VAGMLGLARRQGEDRARQRRAIAAGLHGLDLRTQVEVPLMAGDVHDLEGLEAIGVHLVHPA